MHQQGENLDIIFRRTTPEAVLENIRMYGSCFQQPYLQVDAQKYGENAYEHFSTINLTEYSVDEVSVRYSALAHEIKEGNSVFHLLYAYADEVLTDKKGAPICKMKACLNWNSITRRLGQDLFTTAWFAWQDAEQRRRRRDRRFTWPAIIETDDAKLNSMMSKGLAENHFHLNGSTQSFALSWACLMNHPDHIGDFLKEHGHFKENLHHAMTKGVLDNAMDWRERLLYAAMLRVLLFKRCVQNAGVVCDFQKFDRLPSASAVKRQVEVLRFLYGEYQAQPDDAKKCLDYAITSQCYRTDEKHDNRLLSGERNFLYQCFYLQFSGKFSAYEATLFYLYLVIKSHFRSELIQNNGRTGFANFAAYQDRKNQFFWCFREYAVEAQRLAVCAEMKENHISSLEARIMPEESARKLRNVIEEIDNAVCFVEKELPYYFVIHFPKKRFSEAEFTVKHGGSLMVPRNNPLRKRVKVMAKAVAGYIQSYENGSQRIWGIDACSNEIGCRPEVFATEFRYLRSISKQSEGVWYKYRAEPLQELGITYHVGEDFLDIVNGLRAIDEVLRFLPMKRGDRLGHALALGIEPGAYYEYKRNTVYLTKQDYLDDLVWVLYVSLELNVSIELNRRTALQKKARDLFHEIYGNRQLLENSLDMYYYSWQLRGDHPDLYRTGEYRPVNDWKQDAYSMAMEGDPQLEIYRKDRAVAELYALYHFDPEVKKKGLIPEKIKMSPWWIETVRELQRAMRLKVYKKELALESNPTSNVLIGTFRSYDKHPILTFNNHHLVHDNEPNMSVSVNTDDLGVFDTSLKNEYALLFASISRKRHAEGNYEDDDIYAYLDYLRQNGIDMAFRKENSYDLRK